MSDHEALITALEHEVRVLRARTSALHRLESSQHIVRTLLENASDTLGAPLAAVNLIHATEQVTVAGVGLQTGSTSFDASYCKHVVVLRGPLTVENSEEHPMVRDNLATTRDGLRSYLGVPLITPDELVIGALCVCDHKPRKWSDDDLENLQLLAGRLMELEAELTKTLRDAGVAK